jgi:16S rRNA (cytosine1402-N4)-methyltransferase
MHKPVLLTEVLEFAQPVNPKYILDGTFGRGGHTEALLQAFPAARVVALDQDVQAVEFAQTHFAAAIAEKRLEVVHFNFHDVAHWPQREHGFDLILLDLGVSSPQLDEAHRGFSFYQDGPLDMRMNQTQELSAAEVLRDWSEVELLDLFRRYGEIQRPHRVVRAIVNDRKTTPFTSTLALAQLIERIEGWRKKGHHPATRFFLALRMAVNHELTGLESCIPDLLQLLRVGGRLEIITFHSLEDRIVKYAFREAQTAGAPVNKRVVVPGREECVANPRARSAKLRVFQRGSSDESSTME